MSEETKLILKYELMPTNITAPAKSRPSDAGIDIFTTRKVRIAGHSSEIIPTGVKLEIPTGYHGEIKERSGVSVDLLISKKAGIIDSTYRGEVKIIMANTSPYPIDIDSNFKIAQIILYKDLPVELEQVEEVKENTERGDAGFGSSDQ